jgi:branched-chain amino acid transport system ATP-binding protein
MTVIALHDVSAGYDGVASVHDLSLSVGSGEVVALLGANGAGKTTTVRAVCGLAEIHRGSVEVLGSEATSLPPLRRARLGLGAVPDDRGVFSQLTVAENLRAAGGDKRAEAPLRELFPELRPLWNRRAGLLSGGEQTVLALARALARAPRALVVDELTTGLASGLAAEAFAVLRRVAREWGTGVLVAEQNARLVLGAADRAYVLRRGRIVLEGAAPDVAAQPELLETSFLGEMG